MESTEAPSKRRRFETPLLGASGADEDFTEESTEGHVVVHLNADLLHRIKQEPVDSGETPELTCVALQKDSNDNTFRETLLNESRPDPSNDDRGCASPTIPMMNETSAENEPGIINERISPCIGASPATATTRSRRSVRKRFSVQRSSPEIGVSSSSTYHNLSVSKQSKNALSIRSGHRKRTNTVNQPAFSNQLVSEGSLGSTDACDITGDASDLFKRRFRKMLKDLVAKRMLKLQHSAVYSGTVSALRRKVAILERRNMQLEDKAERLQTSMMNLHNEKEKRATKTVSRGTQVSMGMILSRAWSACQGIDKASSFASEERGSLAIPGDGPVIIKVCGKQVNDASARVQIPKLSEIMRENSSQQQVEPQQYTHSPQTDSALPKIQHVSSGSLLVPQQPRQQPCDFILPEHRLLSNQTLISQGNRARPLQDPNLPSQSSGINNLPVNREVVMVTDQPAQLSGFIGSWPSNSSSSAQQHATGPVNRIATVRPQQFIPSSANISLAQNVPPQAAQMQTLPRPRLESMNLPIPKDNTANISTIISQILPPVHQTDLSSSRPAMTQTQSGNARTTSMSSTVGRRRRPPGGCFCCPPDPNQRHTVGNQNPVRSGDDLRLHPGSNHEATRGQFSTTNQVSPSICTSGARTQGSLSELQPTVPLPYPQQFFPVTQASNKSSCSVPTGELANQIRSSGPNHHQRQNVLPGHVNSPRAGMLCSQALPTIPESIRSAHGKQLTGGPPLQISSRTVPQQSEIQTSSSVVQNPLNQEWSRSHPRESIRAPDQPLSPLSGVDLHPASHPAQRQMFHFTKEQIACNSDGGYATTIRQCSSQQHPQQQQQLPTQPYIQIHQQQVPLQQHPPRQELEQQQQRQQQQRQQPQQQQQLQKQLHQHPRRAGYVPPTPILPKPDSRAHQYWQRNPQFTASGASHCGTSVPQQLPAALNNASSSNFCLNQRPPIQTQFLRPYTPHNVRNGAYLQQPIQPSVQQNQSSVQTSSAPVSQLSVNMVQISKSVSLQRERTGAGSTQHSQTSYSSNTRACLHPNTTHSSLPRQRPNDSERNSARAAKSITPTIYNAANEHLLERRTSFTTPSIATTSIIPTNSFRSAPQSPSMPSEPLLNSPTKTLLPATRTPEPRNTPLRNAQGSELKGNEAITDEASCPATALSSRTGFTTRLLPVQNFVGMKLSDNFKNVNNSETDGNNKPLDSQRDVAGQIVNFSDITEKGDKEGPQLQKDKASYLKPILGVEQSSNGIVLSWDLTSREYESKVIKYELFVTTASSESTGWQSLGVVDALALPMACTMTQFLPGASYYFTVRAITDVGDCGSEMFSHPCSITVLESNQNSSSVSPV